MIYLGLMMTLSVCLTLFLSGAAKVFDLRSSGRSAASIGILPNSLGRLFGYVLPFAEIILAALLLTDTQMRLALVAAALLFAAFITANAIVLVQGKDIACHCFGSLLRGTMGWGGLLHSVIMMICCTVGYLWPGFSVSDLLSDPGIDHMIMIGVPAVGIFLMGMISREILFYR
ncbi:methylamine utilization protein MauE [Paenibacillus cellulosilyticus]|uniref:Methylamine utilization protein MauE n=1 Tax=Paenibacillus cellulosilyticus TaxID=375489 RepID=A0A2V2YNA7_9BACL|nr:MauE/DoxX family redox-associated membrane protein [Paenibacillus cellulosilyticus]PWV95964.1 methylamine utilization protein MauE [Paenibacillus cellulosilyticus]QKS48432.1 hypothetical protein HUB94_29750 [Paenibacillus cellulosilyticus]